MSVPFSLLLGIYDKLESFMLQGLVLLKWSVLTGDDKNDTGQITKKILKVASVGTYHFLIIIGRKFPFVYRKFPLAFPLSTYKRETNPHVNRRIKFKFKFMNILQLHTR